MNKQDPKKEQPKSKPADKKTPASSKAKTTPAPKKK